MGVTQAVDKTGRTPLHHVISSTKHNMSSRSYNLLLRSSSNQVAHQAIRSEASWVEVRYVITAKIDSLSVQEKEEKSGLYPFMIAAVVADGHGRCGGEILGLTVVYELLCLHPDLLKAYDVSHLVI